MSRILKNLSKRLNKYTGLDVWRLENEFDVCFYGSSETSLASERVVSFSFYGDGRRSPKRKEKLGFIQISLSVLEESEDVQTIECLFGLCQAIQVLCLAEPRLSILCDLLSKYLGRKASFDTVYNFLDKLYNRAQTEIKTSKIKTDASHLFSLLTLFAFDSAKIDKGLFLELCKENKDLFVGRVNPKTYSNPTLEDEEVERPRFFLPQKYNSQNPPSSAGYEELSSFLIYALEKWSIRFPLMPKPGKLGSSEIYEKPEAPISNKIPLLVLTHFLFNNYAGRAIVLPIMPGKMYTVLEINKPSDDVDPLRIKLPGMYMYKPEKQYSKNDIYEGYIDCTQISTVSSTDNVSEKPTVKVLEQNVEGSRTVVKIGEADMTLPDTLKSPIKKGLIAVLGVDKDRKVKQEIDLANYFASGDQIIDRLGESDNGPLELPMRFCDSGVYRRDYNIFAENAQESVDIYIRKPLIVSETRISSYFYDTVLSLSDPSRVPQLKNVKNFPAIISDPREVFYFINLLSYLAKLEPIYKIDLEYYRGIVGDEVYDWDPYFHFQNIPLDCRIKFETIRTNATGYRLLSEGEWEYIALGGLRYEDPKYYTTTDFLQNKLVNDISSSSSVAKIDQKSSNGFGLKGVYGGGSEAVGTSISVSRYFTPSAIEENLRSPKSHVFSMGDAIPQPEYWRQAAKDDPSFYGLEMEGFVLKNMPYNQDPKKYSVFRRYLATPKALNTTQPVTFRLCRAFI